jgi:hypothetical protein
MSHQSQIVSHIEGVIVLEPVERIKSLARGQRGTTSGPALFGRSGEGWLWHAGSWHCPCYGEIMSGEPWTIYWIAVFERALNDASVLEVELLGFSKEED